jgi:Protein of unknown function (DUF2628)
MPWESAGNPPDRVVPPARAVFFRLAVGPAADRYVPRFLRYERAGRAAPGWHWPAMLFGSGWAFYRRMWLPGILYALLPLIGAATFIEVEPALGDSLAVWLACAVALIWLLPGVIASLCANSLLYGQVRRLVQRAEALTTEKTGVARLLSERRPTDIVYAVLLGSVVVMITWMLVAPPLAAMYADREVRVKVAEGLAAIRPLQRQVEESWHRFHAIPYSLDDAAWFVRRSGSVIDGVNFNPINGRFRLALGSTIAELADKTIFLAPAVDPWQRLFWVCVPVGISPKHLPLECRRQANTAPPEQ